MDLLSVDALFAYIGLVLAILDFRFKGLSEKIEGLLKAAVAFLLSTIGYLKILEKWISKYSNKYFKGDIFKKYWLYIVGSMLFVFIPAFFGDDFPRNSIYHILYIYGVFFIAPFFMLGVFYLNYLSAVLVIIFIAYFYILPPVYIFCKFYSLMSYLGNGRALTGLGFLLAIYGVYSGVH